MVGSATKALEEGKLLQADGTGDSANYNCLDSYTAHALVAECTDLARALIDWRGCHVNVEHSAQKRCLQGLKSIVHTVWQYYEGFTLTHEVVERHDTDACSGGASLTTNDTNL